LHIIVCTPPFRWIDLDNRRAFGQGLSALEAPDTQKSPQPWRSREVSLESINWLGVVSVLMIAVLVVPAALRRNRNTWLPYAAVWVAAIVALVWAYDSFGPF
jgi:hypothetical protein